MFYVIRILCIRIYIVIHTHCTHLWCLQHEIKWIQCNLLSFVLWSSTLLKISWKIIKRTETNLHYYWNTLHRACSMQQCIFNIFDMPWILQNLLFMHMSFGGKVSLIFLIIYQPSSFAYLPIIPLIFANSCPGWPI